MTVKTTNFGTSAYLRILLLNSRPMETAIKSRVVKKNKGGRDYHASLRRAVSAYIENPIAISEILANFEKIKQKSERQSAKVGFKSTIDFLAKYNDSLYTPEVKIFRNSTGFFTVKFQPNFGIELNGKRTAVHLWNTKGLINQRAVTAVLGLFLDQYGDDEQPAIFCLKTGKIFVVERTRANQRLAIAFSERIDALIQKCINIDQEEAEAKRRN